MRWAWLCQFMQHEWWFIGNVPGGKGRGAYGLYQCNRCKELSAGSPNGPHR